MNANPAAGLYIHIPFCRHICLYCDFYSEIPSEGEIDRFISAIGQEIRMGIELDRYGEYVYDTLFLGGGTPTILNPRQIAALFACLRGSLTFSDTIEITIECNPSSLNEELLRTCKDIGINRISLGVQSFNDSHLVKLGRTHTSNQARAAFRLLRECGFDNISLDLIYGLPDQTPQEWSEDLDKAIELHSEHLSAYNLIIERDTHFGKLHDEGMLNLPSEIAQREMYDLLNQRLLKAGYKRYEISNFTIPSSECRHNLKYWRLQPYIGLGPAAVSFDGVHRWKNKPDLESYLLSLENRLAPPREIEVLPKDLLRKEYIMLSLRLTDGLSLNALHKRFSYDLLADKAAAIEMLASHGYLELENDRLRLTEKSPFISDEIILKLT
jgi:oxygen-independent coproporphyrinogen-3 oxidase